MLVSYLGVCRAFLPCFWLRSSTLLAHMVLSHHLRGVQVLTSRLRSVTHGLIEVGIMRFSQSRTISKNEIVASCLFGMRSLIHVCILRSPLSKRHYFKKWNSALLGYLSRMACEKPDSFFSKSEYFKKWNSCFRAFLSRILLICHASLDTMLYL